MDGARWSFLAGCDCREMAKLFLALHDRDHNRQFPVPEFFRSHPAESDRHQAIMDEYCEEPSYLLIHSWRASKYDPLTNR